MTKEQPPRRRESVDIDSEDERNVRSKRMKTAEEARGGSPEENIVVSTNKLASDVFESSCIPTFMLRYRRVASSTEVDVVELYEITFAYALDMSEMALEQCYKLIEETSRSDYENSTIGWRPRRKRKEMRQSEMRYLTAWRRADAAKHDQAQADDDSHEAQEFQGFLSFMVTHEAGSAVLYIYEIHLAADARGKGLGQHLIDLVDAIAQRLGPAIEKVMLTCFVTNIRAVAFYRKIGFVVDDTSPEARRTRGKIIEPEILIMSKLMKAA